MTMGPQVLQLKNGSAKSSNESSPHEAMPKPMSYTPLQDRRRKSFLASSALSNISTVSSEHDYTHSLSPTGNFLHKDQAFGSSSSSKSDHDTENGSHRASSIISSNINSNEPKTPTPAFTSTVSRISATSSPSELRRRLSINTPSYILTGTERRKFRQRFPPTPLPHVLQTPSAYAGQFGPAVEKGDSGDLNIAAKQRRGTFESVYSAATTMDYFSDISTDVGDGEDRWPEVFANDEEEYEEDPMDYTEEVGRNKNEKKRMNHVYDLKRIVLRNKNKSSTISNVSWTPHF